MRWIAVWGALFGAAAIVAPAMADDIADRLDAARAAYAHGDGLHTLEALQAMEGTLAARLADQFARALPPPPAGWEAAASDSQPLDAIGGGLTVTRGFQKGDTTLNASLIVDNPAVANTLSLFQPGGPSAGEAGWKAITVGSENALLRFDSTNHEGEVVLVLQGRAALEIEGNEIATEQPLVDLAQGWNFALLKKLLGS